MATSESIPHGELNILFTKSVPHVLEKIFFSLDFDSFVACGKVSFAWEGLFSSRLYQQKAYELWREREENEERLCRASINGDAKEVHRLLASGVNPNFTRVDMTSHPLWENALFMAASNGNIEVVKLLLKFGADSNIQNSHGTTPLHAAIWGHYQLVKELLNAGALHTIVDMNGDTPLHLAVVASSLNVVEVLLDAGADPKMTNRQGMTPLNLANRRKSTSKIARMLQSRTLQPRGC